MPQKRGKWQIRLDKWGSRKCGAQFDSREPISTEKWSSVIWGLPSVGFLLEGVRVEKG